MVFIVPKSQEEFENLFELNIETFSGLEENIREGRLSLDLELSALLTLASFSRDSTISDEIYQRSEYDSNDAVEAAFKLGRLNAIYNFTWDSPSMFIQQATETSLARFVNDWYNHPVQKKRWISPYRKVRVSPKVLDYGRSHSALEVIGEFNLSGTGNNLKSLTYPMNGDMLARCLQAAYEKK